MCDRVGEFTESFFPCKPMKKETAHGPIPEGDRGSGPEIGFLSILVIKKLPKPSVKRHLNGISLAG